MTKKTKLFRILVVIFALSFSVIGFAAVASAEPFIPSVDFIERADNPQEVSDSINILLILTLLTLAPSIIIMMTAFTRIVIVLSFMRNALGTQQIPPNQVLIGLALFLTIFIMTPVVNDINNNALQPYYAEQITLDEAYNTASGIIKEFMLKQMSNEDGLAFFTRLAGIDPGTVRPEELPLYIVIPSFIINELTIAFKIGFLIYIPFLIIDMVVSSTLMSMGMMMLPPVMISLPFKVLLFIMVGGWQLVTESVIKSFR